MLTDFSNKYHGILHPFLRLGGLANGYKIGSHFINHLPPKYWGKKPLYFGLLESEE
jgi:hypothetical protein